MFIKKKLILTILVFVLAVIIAFLVSKFSLTLFIIFIGLAVLVPVFFSIDWGINLLLWSFVAGQLIRLPLPFGEGGIVLSDILTGLILIAWIFKKILLKEKFTAPFLALPIFGFIVAASFSLLINRENLAFDEFLASGFYLLRWIEYAGIYFVVSDWFSARSSEVAKEKFILKVSLIGVIISVLGFIQLKLLPDFSPMVKYGWDPHQGRLLSSWFDPNFLGGFFVVLLIIGMSMIRQFYFNKSFRVFYLPKACVLLVSTSVIFIAMVLTYSRSAYLAFLAGFLTVVFVSIFANNSKKRILKLAVFGAIAVIAIAAVIAVFPRAGQRIQGAKNLDITARARIESWARALGSLEDNYLVGVGYNTLRYTQSISVSKLHSGGGFDSSLLTIWLTTGAPGLFFYLWIFVRVIKKSFLGFFVKKNPPLRRAIGLGVLGAIIALLVHSMFVNSLLYPHIMLLVWMIAGLL